MEALVGNLSWDRGMEALQRLRLEKKSVLWVSGSAKEAGVGENSRTPEKRFDLLRRMTFGPVDGEGDEVEATSPLLDLQKVRKREAGKRENYFF
jgi:hypothetical protein